MWFIMALFSFKKISQKPIIKDVQRLVVFWIMWQNSVINGKEMLTPNPKEYGYNYYFILSEENKRIGTIAWQEWSKERIVENNLPEKIAEIGQLTIIPKFRQKGFAEQVIKQIEEVLQSMSFTNFVIRTRNDNCPIIKTALKLGYSKMPFNSLTHSLYLKTC